MRDFVEHLDTWKLADSLTVFQATCLINGILPGEPYSSSEEFDNYKLFTVERLLCSLVEYGYVKSKIYRKNFDSGYVIVTKDQNNKEQFAYHPVIDWDKTMILVEDLKRWMGEKGYKPEFFFTENERQTDIKNHDLPFYSQKLHAAIDAWETVTCDEKYLRGKTPKQAIEKYLKNNSHKYTYPDELSSSQCLEDISKTVNWQKTGGAPKICTLGIVPSSSAKCRNIIEPEHPLYEWQFFEELTVNQIAYLMLGINPYDLEKCYEIDSSNEKSIFDTLLVALTNAVEYGLLKAIIRKSAWVGNIEDTDVPDLIFTDFKDKREVRNYSYHSEGLEEPEFVFYIDGVAITSSRYYLKYFNEMDWWRITVPVVEIKRWLTTKGKRPAVFFSLDDAIPPFCDEESCYFSSSLKAAYDTWNYLKDNYQHMSSQTIKEAAISYLVDNKDKYSQKGEPLSKSLIESIARVVNWDKSGSKIY